MHLMQEISNLPLFLENFFQKNALLLSRNLPRLQRREDRRRNHTRKKEILTDDRKDLHRYLVNVDSRKAMCSETEDPADAEMLAAESEGACMGLLSNSETPVGSLEDSD